MFLDTNPGTSFLLKMILPNMCMFFLLSIEFIAYLRRAIAHQGQGLNQEAKEDLSQLLAIEPNNKRAKVVTFYEINIFL